MLIFILSQGLIYFKNVKNGELTNNPSVKEITNFIKECPIEKLPKQTKYKIRQRLDLSGYLKWAIKNPQTAKELANKKVFVNLDDLNNKVFDMKFPSQELSPEIIDDLVYSYHVADKLMNSYNIDPNYRGNSVLGHIYNLVQSLNNIGINKNKLTYNLGKLLNMKYPLEQFSPRRIGLIQIIQIGNLEFNNFVDYLQRITSRELLFICDNNYYDSGCFSIKEYYDYLNMQFQMYGKIKEKYPDNWLTTLQIMKAKFNAWKQLHKDEQFLNNANRLKYLEYSDDKYCIVIPTKSSDVVDEGVHLGHCVGSYVDRIIRGETNILFMRKVNEPEESLVTLEFKDNMLCQYKGFGDRAVNEEEDEFLTKWCKEKNIEKAARG